MHQLCIDFLCMLSLLLGKDLEVECLGHMVGICLAFYETAKFFYKVMVQFYVSTGNM
jgi:hypothetical protein